MALDTFSDAWRRTLLRCPLAGPFLAQDWIRNAFRKVAEKRLWSWLIGYGQFIVPALTNTGLVTATNNQNTVIGNAAAAATWSGTLVGQQFRISSLTPIYTILTVTTTTNPNDTLTLDATWGGTTQTLVGYEIYQAYVKVPTDFLAFRTVIDPQRNWQLWANRWSQSDLNTWDAQRASAGNPYAVVYRDMDPSGAPTPPVARYELWPHQKTLYAIPYLYDKRATDISDSGSTIPRLIRGDVLVEGALVDAARWPGAPGQPNPYFNLALASQHEAKFQTLVGELERQDNEIFEQNVQYQVFTQGLPWAPFPGDARFIQSHLLPASYGGTM